MSFAKAQDPPRLAQMAALRRGGVNLEDICAEFDVSHRPADDRGAGRNLRQCHDDG